MAWRLNAASLPLTLLGWNRESVQLGLHERRSGITCVANYRARGRHKSEAVLTNLEVDIRSLVDVQAQADPKLQSTFLYVRISAAAVREALIGEKGYEESDLPPVRPLARFSIVWATA